MANDLPVGGTPMRFNKFAVSLLRWPTLREWELTLFLGPLQLRIGNMQQAAWWKFKTIFSVGRRVRECRRAMMAK